MILFQSASARLSIEQASHDIGSVGVSMAEAEPAGTVPHVVYVAVISRLKVDDKLEAVVFADALHETKGLEALQALAVHAYGNGVVWD